MQWNEPADKLVVVRQPARSARYRPKLYHLAMTLIETYPGESDADLRAVTDDILQMLNPDKVNWWHPYELRGTYRRGDKVFREFYCIAGSVQIWLLKLAGEKRSREVLVVEDDAGERAAV